MKKKSPDSQRGNKLKYFIILGIALGIALYKYRDQKRLVSQSIDEIVLKKPLNLQLRPSLGCNIGDINSMNSIIKANKANYILFTVESFHNTSQKPLATHSIDAELGLKQLTNMSFTFTNKPKERYFGLFACTSNKRTGDCRSKPALDMAKIADIIHDNPFQEPKINAKVNRDYVLYFQPMEVDNGRVSFLSSDVDLASRLKSVSSLVDSSSLAKRIVYLMKQTSSVPIKVQETTSSYNMQMVLPGYDREACQNVVKKEHQEKVERIKSMLRKTNPNSGSRSLQKYEK